MVRKSKVRLSHVLEYGVYRLIEFLLSLLPMRAVCKLGRGVGSLGYYSSTKYRLLVLKNLRIAVGESYDLPALEKLSLETFKKGGANFMASLKASTMKPDKVAELLRVRGYEHLAALEEEGKGAIVAMGHMGSWEVLTRLNQMMSAEANWGAVFRPLNNPLMDRLIRKRRSAENLMLFSNKESFLKGALHLKEGGFLLILSDQRAARVGTLASFFGRVSSCIPLPALLAKRNGVGVLVLSMEMTDLGEWEVVIERVREEGGEIKTSDVMEGVEKMMSRSLSDGFWFHDRWRLTKAKPFSISYKKSDLETVRQGKPVRIICHGAEQREEWTRQMEAALPAVEVTHTPLSQDVEGLVSRLNHAEDQMESPFELVIDAAGGQTLAGFAKEKRIPFYSNTGGLDRGSFLNSLGAKGD